MTKVNISDRFIQSLRLGGDRLDYTDTNPNSIGMKLRVNQSSKVFSIVYASGGVRRRFMLGAYPQIGLREARALYNETRAKINRGEDPSLERQIKKRAADDGLTFEKLSVLFMDLHASRNLKPKTIKEYQRLLDIEINPMIGYRPAEAIIKREVINCIEKVAARGALVQANRVLQLISGVYNWAVSDDYVSNNPAYRVSRRAKERARSNVLTDDEIKAFWHNFKAGGMTDGVDLAAKLELIMGSRTSEITQQLKSNIVLTNSPHWLSVDTKNKSSHKLPLSWLAIDIIKKAMELSGDSVYLFPSPKVKNSPIGSNAVPRAIGRRCKDLGFHFTSHDLRRTLNTRLARNGIDKDMRHRILNHGRAAAGDVNEDVYNWHKYEDEISSILNNWADQLWEIINSKI